MWPLFSVFASIRDEYRGFKSFHQATDTWPVWSITTSSLSIPALFAAYLFAMIRIMEQSERVMEHTKRLELIYASLLIMGILAGFIYWTLRVWARKLDLLRAEKAHHKSFHRDTCENLLR